MTTFNVFHRTAFRFETGNREAAAFVHVAKVEADDLDRVFRNTNHIDYAWWDNEGVTVVGIKNHRSTSVGDEIENTATGERWVVAAAGFEIVSSPRTRFESAYKATNPRTT
jgi:hypothetical protein